MKKIKVILIFSMCLFLLSGCQKEKKISTDENADKYIQYNEDETIAVVAAPEVDDGGNPVLVKTRVKKPDTDISKLPEYLNVDIPNNLSAKECLEKWLSSFKQSDWVNVGLFSDTFSENIHVEDEEMGAASYVYSNIEWEIGRETKDGNKTKFIVTISVPDISESLKEYIKTKSIEISDKNIKKKINKDIKKMVKNAEIQKKEIEISLYQEDTIWKVELTNELLSIMTGDLSNLYRELLQDYYNEVFK